jgi:hypothetical protein
MFSEPECFLDYFLHRHFIPENSMKHFSFLLLALAAITFTACKHSTDASGGGGANQVVMTATVNGNAWSGIIPFTGTYDGYYDFSAGDSNSDIAIYYYVNDTGTYPIDDTTIIGSYLLGQDLYQSTAHSGFIHFSVLSKTQATGTFNFVAQDSAKKSVTITNGTFTIPL